MKLTVEFDCEDDGRGIAEILDLPGVMTYGPTRKEALAAVKALALRVLADKLEHGEISADLLELSFGIEAA
jgi:predicted RNase H-like HicB family nuclease